MLVASKAAGEGMNSQLCWLMSNDDIPWNPERREQRRGHMHVSETNIAERIVHDIDPERFRRSCVRTEDPGGRLG